MTASRDDNHAALYNGPVPPQPVTEWSLPDENVMRYVIGQFSVLARLVEMGGEVCERVQTAGGGSMCKRHGWPWTDSKPCPVVGTIGRRELVTHLRTLANELADFLSSDDESRAPGEAQ